MAHIGTYIIFNRFVAYCNAFRAQVVSTCVHLLSVKLTHLYVQPPFSSSSLLFVQSKLHTNVSGTYWSYGGILTLQWKGFFSFYFFRKIFIPMTVFSVLRIFVGSEISIMFQHYPEYHGSILLWTSHYECDYITNIIFLK